LEAAVAAQRRFDNETSIAFFESARRAARAQGIALDLAFHRGLGEALLRIGALEESLVSLEAALALARTRLDRAAILGRIAWSHFVRIDPQRSWRALDHAFEVLDLRMPVESPLSAADTVTLLAKAELSRFSSGPRHLDEASRAEVDLICALHYQ